MNFFAHLVVISDLTSLSEIFKILLYELQTQKFKDAMLINCTLLTDDAKKIREWESNKMKTFMENLYDLATWYQIAMKEEKYSGGWINILWPKTIKTEVGIIFNSNEINLSFEERDLLKWKEAFWDDLVEFVKRLAIILPTDFAFSGLDQYLDESVTEQMKDLFKNQKVLRELPRLDEMLPERLKAKWKPYYNIFPSFIILSPERYKASEPYIANWTVQHIEELPNGCVFLFTGYPIDFDALRERKRKKERGEKTMFVPVTVQPNEDLDEAYQRITSAFEAAGYEVYHPFMLNEILPTQDFARLFIIFTEEEAHTFFICPYEWTEEREELMMEAINAVEQVEGVGKHVIHFIAAFPLPESLESLSE